MGEDGGRRVDGRDKKGREGEGRGGDLAVPVSVSTPLYTRLH